MIEIIDLIAAGSYQDNWLRDQSDGYKVILSLGQVALDLLPIQFVL